MLDRPTRLPEKPSYMPREIINVPRSNDTYTSPRLKYWHLLIIFFSFIALILALCYELTKN